MPTQKAARNDSAGSEFVKLLNPAKRPSKQEAVDVTSHRWLGACHIDWNQNGGRPEDTGDRETNAEVAAVEQRACALHTAQSSVRACPMRGVGTVDVYIALPGCLDT